MDYHQIKEIIKTVEQVETLMSRLDPQNISDEIAKVLKDTSILLNRNLYGTDHLFSYSNDIVTRVSECIKVWRQSSERRLGKGIEREFWRLYEYLDYADLEVIISETIDRFESRTEDFRKRFVDIRKYYPFLTCSIDPEKNDYSLIRVYSEMMKENIDNFKYLFFRLSDNRSRWVLLRIVRYWFEFVLDDLLELRENIYEDYYDLDLLNHKSGEVLVDCGAFNGDSIIGYIDTYGADYKRIYGYEISPITFHFLKENLEGYDNVEIRQKGVGAESGQMFMKDIHEVGNASLVDRGSVAVDVVTIDEDIDEPVSAIKMDIEGMETEALKGAAGHIRRDRPQLMICAYHRPDDIFMIPRLIDGIRDDYKMYLRYNGGGFWPSDYVLFAV